MLGITTPDAIALGTLIIAVLAAWSGRKSGDAAKKANSVIPSSMSTFGDIEILTTAVTSNTAAVIKLTALMELDAKRHEVDEEVQKKLEIRMMQMVRDQWPRSIRQD